MILSILTFIAILSVLVLIHEFGHFYSAKKLGVWVEEFGWGIPPRAWGKKFGDTLYSINWLPFGGFVKLYGEDSAEFTAKTDPKSFMSKPVWARCVIVLAGIFMNLVLGVSLYYILLSTNNFQSEPLMLLKDYKFKFGDTKSRQVVINLADGYPAEKGGVVVGDLVQRFKTTQSNDWVQIEKSAQLINILKDKQDISVDVEFKNVRTNEIKIVTLTPQYNEELKRSVIGIGLGDSVVINYQKPNQKLFAGFMHSYNVIDYTFSIFGDLIASSVQQQSLEPVGSSVSGPVGIYSVVDEIVKSSGAKVFRNLADITALLSLSLAIMNVLPLPALDGGRLMFFVWEGITKKPVSQKVEGTIHQVGFLILIGLLIAITFKDVWGLF